MIVGNGRSSVSGLTTENASNETEAGVIGLNICEYIGKVSASGPNDTSELSGPAHRRKREGGRMGRDGGKAGYRKRGGDDRHIAMYGRSELACTIR